MDSLRYKHRRPTHPGKIIREDILPVLEIPLPELCKRLKVSRQLLNDLINERTSITADVAVKLSRVMGRTPSSWLKMQQAVDLWDLENSVANKSAAKKLANDFKRKSKLRTA